jgi:hypothetical protein
VEATRIFVCDAVAHFGFLSATQSLFWFFGFGFVFCGGIRDLLSLFTRCPCAGRHLLSLPPQRK